METEIQTKFHVLPEKNTGQEVFVTSRVHHFPKMHKTLIRHSLYIGEPHFRMLIVVDKEAPMEWIKYEVHPRNLVEIHRRLARVYMMPNANIDLEKQLRRLFRTWDIHVTSNGKYLYQLLTE